MNLAQESPALFDQALAIHKAGDLPGAELLYRRVLAANPSHADSLHLLGLVAGELNRPAEAIASIEAALRVRPGVPVYLANLGLALRRAGHLDEALAAYDLSIGRMPSKPETHYKRGCVLRDLRRLEEAAAAFAEAAGLDPTYTEAHFELGNVLHLLNRNSEAADAYRRATALDPGQAEAHFNLAVALMIEKRLEEAETAYRRALELNPGHHQAWNNLGHILQARQATAEALDCYRRSIALKPDYIDARYNLGVALQGLDRPDQAFETYSALIALKPDHADAHNNRAGIWLGRNDVRRALDGYRAAAAFDPAHNDANWNIGLCHLTIGEWDPGWAGYDWRLRSRTREFTAPHWRGEDVSGKTIFLVSEQGLGDTIQFIRYTRWFEARGARVIFDCQSRLEPLLHPPAPQPYDFHCWMLSAPRYAKDIPAEAPYLTVPPERVAYWKTRMKPDGLRVGLCWQGNPHYKANHKRSLALEQLAPLGDVEGVDLYSLQRDCPDSGIPGLDQLESDHTDIADTAAILMNLDLVITVDTMIAHLAGALGRPVWTMLAFAPDWRWMLNRADSLWYPTMRLYRQPVPGDWASVVEQIESDLTARSCANTPCATATPWPIYHTLGAPAQMPWMLSA